MDEQTSKRLHADLVKLGDMMGDGMHHEPGGRWIEQDYKRVARALGYGPKRRNNGEAIDKAMASFLAKTPCPKCSGKLQQTRSGSKRAACSACGEKFQCGSSKTK